MNVYSNNNMNFSNCQPTKTPQAVSLPLGASPTGSSRQTSYKPTLSLRQSSHRCYHNDRRLVLQQRDCDPLIIMFFYICHICMSIFGRIGYTNVRKTLLKKFIHLLLHLNTELNNIHSIFYPSQSSLLLSVCYIVALSQTYSQHKRIKRM